MTGYQKTAHRHPLRMLVSYDPTAAPKLLSRRMARAHQVDDPNTVIPRKGTALLLAIAIEDHSVHWPRCQDNECVQLLYTEPHESPPDRATLIRTG